jgi:imidazolonepropionase-like amidohydrolase
MDDEYIFSGHAKYCKDIVEAGGKCGIGAHGQIQGIGYHWEMWMMGSGGMSNHDVLRVATILAADGIGMAADIGSIESGKMADLVIMDKNPLDNIRNTNTIKYVMKNGRLYEGSTLDEIYPRKKALPKFEWQNGGPSVEAGMK